MALTNISRDDSKTLFIDAATITAIHIGAVNDKGSQEMSLYTAEGLLLTIDTKSWNVEPETAVKNLRLGGAPLAHFPMRWPGETGFVEYNFYINPEAVTFVRSTYEREDGTSSVIFGVAGPGREECGYMRREELNELLNAIAAVKTMDEYKSPERFQYAMQTRVTYVDPLAVTEVNDNRFQVRLSFEGAGWLDMDVARADSTKIANQIWQKGKDPRSLEEIFDEAGRIAEKMDIDARRDFTKAIAAGRPDLIHVPAPDRGIYVARENINFVNFADDERDGLKYMSLHRRRTPGNPYPDAVQVVYKTAEERQQAFDAVQAALAVKAPALPARQPKRASPQP